MKDELTTARFWRAAGLRALRSFAQAFLTLGGLAGANLFSLAWQATLGAAAALALASLLTSVAFGIPEAPDPRPADY